MAIAVQGIFSTSASPAPTPRTSSPPQDGGFDFQSVLDQSKSASTPAPSSDSSINGPDAPATKRTHSAKENKASHAPRAGKPATRAQRPAIKTQEQDEENDGTPEGGADVAALPQTSAAQDLEPDVAKSVEIEKTPVKGKAAAKAALATDMPSAFASEAGRKVQPVKDRERKQPDTGKDGSRRATVRAVSSGQSADSANPASASSASASETAAGQAAQTSQQTQTRHSAAGTPAGKEKLAIQPSDSREQSTATAQPAPTVPDAPSPTAAASLDDAPAESTSAVGSDDAPARAGISSTNGTFADLLGAAQASGNSPTHSTPAAIPSATVDPTPVSAEAQFAQANHSQIVSGIHGQLLPSGGNMQLRLDPPELGTLNVIVRIHEGVMSAAFETSNDQATRLLSHSLSQLKTSLEAQGVSVGKLHVQQSPRNQQSDSQSNDERPSHDGNSGDAPGQREQQRREMLRRMWRRLSGAKDPLDLVA